MSIRYQIDGSIVLADDGGDTMTVPPGSHAEQEAAIVAFFPPTVSGETAPEPDRRLQILSHLAAVTGLSVEDLSFALLADTATT